MRGPSGKKARGPGDRAYSTPMDPVYGEGFSGPREMKRGSRVARIRLPEGQIFRDTWFDFLRLWQRELSCTHVSPPTPATSTLFSFHCSSLHFTEGRREKPLYITSLASKETVASSQDSKVTPKEGKTLLRFPSLEMLGTVPDSPFIASDSGPASSLMT
ncbi:unnamed protein product [Rangifer tarandus platyrhynchus]|uniref:Uncharacterized protein n=2 Tax=Rangifer tarandus platyrhynchus TaxID=3082113 RepID=A0AC59Z2E9_RANTA|nr:unnamed protein product [Rangifer tarandus platyrhynchus]